MKRVSTWLLVKESISDWFEDDAPRLAAALAYYTIFSVAPLLIIAIAIAGFALGEQAVQGQVVGQIKGVMGEEAAGVIQSMIESARKSPKTMTATIVSIFLLLLGATALVGQLKTALNQVWEVQAKTGSGIKGMIRDRFLALLMVLGIGILLLGSLVASTAIVAVRNFAETLVRVPWLWQWGELVFSFAVMTVLFAMLFKYLPDVRIAWSDVWIGAVVTALLFNVGKYAIGFYLAKAAPASSYGAAGSVIVVLLWTYYSALIFLLGAEFTQVYATRYGSHLRFSAAMPEEKRKISAAMPQQEPVAREDMKVMETKPTETKQTETQYLENEAYRAKEALKRTLRNLGSTAQQAANPHEWPAGYRYGILGTVALAGVAAGTVLFKKTKKAPRSRRPTRDRDRIKTEENGKSMGQTLLATVLGAASGMFANALQTAVRSAVSSVVTGKPSSDTSEYSSEGRNVPH